MTLNSLHWGGHGIKRAAINFDLRFGGHLTLKSMDLSENRLSKLSGLGKMPGLTSLKLASHTPGIVSLEGLEVLPALKELDVSKN